MSNFIDEMLFQLYSSSLSIMDVAIISLLSGLANEIHWSIWFLILPWLFYSTHQKLKYDEKE